jgi:hypothetical protein
VNKPNKGIVYLNIRRSAIQKEMLLQRSWKQSDGMLTCCSLLVDSSKRNYSSSLQIGFLEANNMVDSQLRPVTSVQEALESFFFFFRAAHQYRSDHKHIPVFLGNANRLAQYQPEILNLLQDYAS